MVNAPSSSQVALPSAVRKHCETLIKDALGYDPVLVHAPDGKKVLTYRTADDRDWLVVHLTDALLAAGYRLTSAQEAEPEDLGAIQGIIRAKLEGRHVLASIAPGYGGLSPRTEEDSTLIAERVGEAFLAGGYRFTDGRLIEETSEEESPRVVSWVGVVQEFIDADTFTAHLLPTEESEGVAAVLADFSVEDLGGGPIYVDDIFYITVTSRVEPGRGRQNVSSIRLRPRSKDTADSLAEAMR